MARRPQFSTCDKLLLFVAFWGVFAAYVGVVYLFFECIYAFQYENSLQSGQCTVLDVERVGADNIIVDMSVMITDDHATPTFNRTIIIKTSDCPNCVAGLTFKCWYQPRENKDNDVYVQEPHYGAGVKTFLFIFFFLVVFMAAFIVLSIFKDGFCHPPPYNWG